MKQKRTYISSQGVTFVEKPDGGMKTSGNIRNFTIHKWYVIGERDLKGEICSSVGGVETWVSYKLLTRAWFRFILIPYLKFKIVRWLYKSAFDHQLKQKGKRYGLKIIRQRPK